MDDILSGKIVTVRKGFTPYELSTIEIEGDPRKLHDAMLANIKRIKDDMAKFAEDAEVKEN